MQWIRILTAAAILLSLSLEDLRSERIPASRSLLLAGTAFLRLLTAPAPGTLLLSMLTGSALLFLLLLAFIWLMDHILSLHLGFYRSALMLLLACLLALAGELLLRSNIRSRFPFVPYLSLSAFFFLVTDL